MSSSVLFKRHFQVAYLVDDAQTAMDMLKKQFGVEKWDVMDMVQVHGSGSAVKYICNAWVGDMMIEVIEPDESVESLYQGWKKESGQTLRFHHLGFLVDTPEEFSAARDQLAASGFPIVAEGSFGEVLDFAYADTTRETGHYYELIRLKADGNSFFGRIPVN